MTTRLVGSWGLGALCVLLSACGGPSNAVPKESVTQTQQAVVLSNPVGEIQAFAGDPSGVRGFSPSGTNASTALLNSPQGLALGPDGKLYISDTGNNRIVRVDGSVLTTVVGGQVTAGGLGYGNLLANPGAETPQATAGSIPGWQIFGGASTWDALSHDAADPTLPEPIDGDFFFYGGATATARLLEQIDVTGYPGTVNGTQWFSFTGYVQSLDQGATSDQAKS